MRNEDAIKWLENLKQDIWSTQTIDEIIELLKNYEDLEKKYTSLLEERLSELTKENAKLNFKMNQAIFEQSIHTVDRR